MLSDIPTAVTEANISPTDQEILVLTDSSGLVAFDLSGNYIGQIEVPVQQGNFQGGQGIVFAPQPCGATPVLVVCGGQNAEVTAFQYPGKSAFSANGMAYFNSAQTLYTGDADFGGCVPGPGNTFFATENGTVGQYEILTGCAYPGGCNGSGSGLFASSQGEVNGVAVDSSGDVLIVGDDGSSDGFVALFNSGGVCKQARSGGSCSLTCTGGCVTGDPALTGTPLYGAAFFNGVFLVTASTTNPNAMNTILQTNPSSALAVSNYFVGPSGTDFYGIFAAPQPL